VRAAAAGNSIVEFGLFPAEQRQYSGSTNPSFAAMNTQRRRSILACLFARTAGSSLVILQQ
jgi:hypothetical protein